MRRFLWFLITALWLIGSVILSQSTVTNPHRKLRWDCQDCHTTESWSKMRDSLLFDHAATGFVLVGAHTAAQCIGCHKSPVFNNVGVSCIDCHTDHHNGQLGTDCQSCHTPRDWQNRSSMLELHSSRGFALTGAHAVADCEVCHIGHERKEYAGTPMVCYDCHSEAYAATQDPPHAAAGFPHDCRICHPAATASWLNADYQHPAAFPLVGGHRGVDCKRCHGTSYTALPTDCYSCHSADFASTAAPSHTQQGFGHDCTICHTIYGWTPSSFNHAATAFPLTGAHATLTCISCHASGYAGTPTDCYSCHQTAYEQVQDPNHVLGNFSHDCLTCHTTAAWQPSSFNHGSTGFALTGQHTTLKCSACHATSFPGTPTDCYSCHQAAFEGTTSPNHVQQGFDHDCTICHTTSGWTPSSFNHANTAFPLTGVHATTPCVSCHAAGYVNTPTDCYSCHQSVYESAADPIHVLANFDHDCATCHTTGGWTPSTWDHSVTGFALTGTHATTTCVSCHATAYAGTPTDCYSCHQAAYQGVVDPNHVTGNFDHNCVICHTTTAWSPASFDHSTTAFALTGAHVATPCMSCHASGFAGTPTDCYSCHQAAYQGVLDPNHVTGNFDHNCTICHTTTAWSPSSFNHANTTFPLTGVHATTSCASCHASGFAGTPTACYACHQSNYAATSNPNHAAAGFPTDCQTCHTTSGWTPANWNHDGLYFPIYSGRHAGVWSTCADCHVNPASYVVFECINCHTHNKTDTDSHHTEVQGYQYLSTACYTCHPQGTTP